MDPNQDQNHKGQDEAAISEIVSQLIDRVHPPEVPAVQDAGTSVSPPTSTSAATPISQTQSPEYPQPQTQPQPAGRGLRQTPLDPREVIETFEIYRTRNGFEESHSDVVVNVNVRCRPTSPASLAPVSAPSSKPEGSTNVPPTYSAVLRQGRPSLNLATRNTRSMEVQHVPTFPSRVFPPPYNEVDGVWSREISTASSEQVLFGPDPIYIWCARCNLVVFTVTHSERSKFTHFTACALCLCGCWPCCLLPYCMNSCKNTYHYCPNCNYLFGLYRPW